MTSRSRERIAEVRQAARTAWQDGDVEGALDRYEVLVELATQDYALFHDALHPDADRILAEALTLALLPSPAAADPRRARRYARLAMAHHAGQDHERIGWAADFARIDDRDTALELVRYLRRCRGPHAAWVQRHRQLAPLAGDPEFRGIFADLDADAVTARNVACVQRAFGRRPLPEDLRIMLAVYWTGRWETEGPLRHVRFFHEGEVPLGPSSTAPSPAEVAHRAVLRHVVPVLRPNEQYLPQRAIGYWLHPEELSEPPPVIALGAHPGEYELLGTDCTLAEALVWTLHDGELSWREYLRTQEGGEDDTPEGLVLDDMVAWFRGKGIRVRRHRRGPGALTVHPKVLYDTTYGAELARDASQTRLWDWFDRSRGHALPFPPGVPDDEGTA